MKTKSNLSRSAVFVFSLLSIAYVLLGTVFSEYMPRELVVNLDLLDALVLFLLFSSSIFLRYIRWHVLMSHYYSEHRFVSGMCFYIAGFAYTATPGKVGELTRVIYYQGIGVSSDKVISSFLIERFFDLLVVLVLASVVFFSFPGLTFVAVSILVIILMIAFLTVKVSMSKRLCKSIRKLNRRYVTRFALLVYKVLLNMNMSLNFRLGVVCIGLGSAAWTLTALTLVYCCFVFDLALPFAPALSVYPAAMLSGAVSFIPGGIGVTEGAIVYLLYQFDIALSVGGFVALVVRFSTLWLAMLFGFIATLLSGLYILRK